MTHISEKVMRRRGRNQSDVTTSHRMPGAIRNWGRQGMDFPLELLDGVGICQYLDFNAVILILNFCAPELGE